jgi:hypothetical protein
MPVLQWGRSGDTPVLGDFDGDQAFDLGVVRQNETPGVLTWFIRYSNFGYTASYPNTATLNGFIRFGNTSDRVVPHDYDGDGRTDVAVWRPSDGTWYVRQSSSATFALLTQPWGISGDIPQPADYDGDRRADFAVFRPNADPTQNFWYIRNSETGTLTAIEWGQQGDMPVTAPHLIQ